MIIELTKGTIKIQPMSIPELTNRTFIQYVYESGTEHLQPRLTINKSVFLGDRLFVNMATGVMSGLINLKVELLDDRGKVLHRYENSIEHFPYHVFGSKPVRPDVEIYIQNLKAEIEHLNRTIKALEEKGEVI